MPHNEIHMFNCRINKFAMEAINYTDKTCIIVVESSEESRKVPMGIVVDAVSEVMNIKGADIEDAPEFGSRLNTECILGMAKTGGKVRILLDIDKVLGAEGMTLMDRVA